MELVDYGARWYDPQIGRWLSPDTIIPDPTNLQSLNRYSYVYGNPLKFTDPSGHCPVCHYIGRAVNEYFATKIPSVDRARRDAIGGQLIVDNMSEITTEAFVRDNMDMDLIRAVLRHEGSAAERRMATSFAGSKPGFMANNAEYVQFLLQGDNASIGPAQIQVRRARELEELGYATPKSDEDRISALLDDKGSIEYIGASLEYINDQLNTIPGFNELSVESQQRLIVIGYNQGWEILDYNIKELGIEELINRSPYDNQTLDEYDRWMEEGFH